MVANKEEPIRISKNKIAVIIDDPKKTAAAAQLVYVNDAQKGIGRVRKGKVFYYIFDNKPITNKKELERIKKLGIPPAWKKVWICSLSNGHLQATGFDQKDRKQYRYHNLWNNLRNQTKFYRLLQFGNVLTAMRQKIESDLALPGLPVEKVLAAAVSLMERTNIRVGSAFYEKLYGSFGLTTLKDNHVHINGSKIAFSFRGKKGVPHTITLKSRKLANIIQQCREIPGKELFQYVDEEGQSHSIDSGMVNDYIKRISGEEFTAKEFRTWSGTVHALRAFSELDVVESDPEIKKNIVQVVDKVSVALGNSRAVCKKYYVHPILISLYEKKVLNKYLTARNIEDNSGKDYLATEEKALLKILQLNVKN